MRQVNVAEAKAQLSALIDAALAGEEIIIARRNKPAVRLAIAKAPSVKQRNLGAMAGSVLYVAPDFDHPLSEFEEYMPTEQQVAEARRKLAKKKSK
ncbi:MAG: type II toxin-antitoxin system prevent-host-death family antitoxin [Myxococcales bacterium]|nr:type II toxin-antitoxin system prevent-host-death family antitoxin [Myxococcales bacterium]